VSLDLGDLGTLATAIGLVDASGNPVEGWFADPGRHLSRVLANPAQRQALVALVDDLLGGPDASTDAGGVTWLPLVDVENGTLRVFLTLKETAGGATVRVGAGVRVRVAAGGVACEVDAHVPLFAASGSVHVTDPLLLGKPGAPVDVALRLRLPTGTAAGRVELAGVELGATIPTAAGEEPAVRLALRGLRMPGASAPRDLVVDAARASELDDALLELVLGLVAAQAAALPSTSPVAGLAAVLGLADDRVPDFPVADLLARGPVALVDWLAAALTGTAREDWMAGLARLLGGSVAGPGTPGAAVEVNVGGVTVRLEMRVTPGASGRPVVTPRLSAGVAGGPGARLALSADLVSLDLGSGAAVGLPRLALTGRIDPPGTAKLLEPVTLAGGLTLSVGALEAGFALDAARRPVLVLTAEDADVGATHYAALDLSTPEALAAVAGQAVLDAADALVRAIGPAGTALAILLGFEDPPGVPALPRLAPAEFLRDPVGAVRARWRALLTTPAHAAAVPRVLEALRDALADQRVRTALVAGTGTAADPWRVPLAPGVDLLLARAGDVATVSVRAGVGGALGTTGIVTGLELRVAAARLDLATGSAGFLPGVEARLALTGAGDARLQLGAEGIAASVASLGVAVAWDPAGGVRVVPVAADARLQLPEGEVLLPTLAFGPGGGLLLGAAEWEAVERLLGALAVEAARRANLPWLRTAAGLVGWAAAAPSLAGSSGSARLSLAGLVADPQAALRAFAAALVADEDALRTLLEALAALLARAGLDGRGSAFQPWRVPLVSVPGPLAGGNPALRPSLVVALGGAGPAAPSSRVPPALRAWVPGDDGFGPGALASALGQEAALDEVLADLLTDRGNIAQGLQDLIERWTGTDGLVTLPDDGLPAGVTVHRPSELAHGEPLGGERVAELLEELQALHFDGAAPAVTVFVAVDDGDRHGAPAVLPGATAGIPTGRVIDLTAPGLPPEAFTPPPPTSGGGPQSWAVRLGTRAACRLPAGHPAGPDPDGVAGQAARLRRVLAPLAAAGADVVAHGGAGHATVRAVGGVAGVRSVVTLGTPWSTVTADTLDALPAGEALRLLAALLRIVDAAAADPADTATDPAEPDDADLGRARQCVAALLDRDPFADPLADLRPPGSLAAPAGIPVHAVVGSLSPPALRRSLTAVVAAALAARARARAAARAPTAPAPARAGLWLPLAVGGTSGGLRARIGIDVDLAGVARDGGEGPPLTGPGVRVRLELGAAAGWLVGGPDPGRGAGGARPLACRRLAATVELPVRSWGSPLAAPPARTRLVLHEAAAFGTVRDRWVVAAGAGAPAGATPLLPEVRAILAEVAARLRTAAASDPAIGALDAALAALGVVGSDGGVDAVTLERLLLDPEATAAAARGDAARRERIAAALRAMAVDLRTAASAGDTADLRYGSAGELVARLDLAAPAVTVTGSGTLPPWAVRVSASPAGMQAEARLGPDLAAPGALPGAALVARVSLAGISAELRTRGVDGVVAPAVLWPAPNAALVLDALTAVVPGLLLQALVEALRSSLTSLAPAAAAAVDALLDAAGVLAPPASATGIRPLRSLAGVVADPAAWLRALPTGIGGALPALLDAVRALLGATGPAGTLPLADGVALRAAVAGGRVSVGVEVDATAFTAPTGGLGLLLAGGIGVSLPAGAAAGGPLPDVRLAVGATGVGALRLRVGPDAGGAGDAVGATLTLAPDGRPEVVLLPAGPGLAGLADAVAAGAVAALPALLDALAALDPSGAATSPGQVAGRLVARVGDALALRSGTPPRFDRTALAAFGADPAAALSARGAALAAGGLTLLTQAVQPLLGPVAGRTATVTPDGALEVAVGPVRVRLRPGTPMRVEAGVTLTGLSGIERLAAALAVTPAGLALLDVAVGPASLNAGVVTLAPFGRVRVGATAAEGRTVEVGLGVGADRRLVFRWNLVAGTAGLVAVRIGATPADVTESTAPAAVALAVVGAVLDLAGGVVLAVPAVRTALGTALLGTTVGALLERVLLMDGSTAPGSTPRLDPALAGELADPVLLLRRVGQLAANLADAPNAALPIAGVLLLRMVRREDGGTPVFGLNLSVNGSWALNPGDDVVVSLEEETDWITAPGGPVPQGLTVELLDLPNLPAAGPPHPRPGLVVGGLGVRISRTSGPLLDAGISVNSVAVHLFGSITAAGTAVNVAGGARLELAGLGVGLAGARGGDNRVAQGVMGQAGSGEDAPAPRFSPAVAVQKHPGQPVRVTLTAGPGSGPWWLTIQRQFGPVYLEQVGLAVVNPPAGIESVGVLIDGGVSLMGLSASVDDLSLTYVVAGGGSALDPSRWRVDLAGFAVAAEVGGVSLAGGLRRFTPPGGGVEYLGMLMARVAVYGLSVYGGYGIVGPENDRYTSLFLFGAVNGPIGGPPAFFITGIGGGFGINRRLSLPSDLSQFPRFPLIKALDPAARPGDPFQELADARGYFTPERGTFWFAAGLSFNSFALVDGIAVVAVQIGGGFELSLLGLARMALPRPQAPLVYIEMALVARFSTREGVILVQAQLTDNSWLLAPAVRLTGGFAFATWFAGPNRGQFVVTLGGYHPDFHRDGYPVVPRLGLAWRLGDAISVVGESYFALTSEALMAGMRVEISARFGPAWAHVVFGGDGIVYFDPFWLSVTVYASIDAGVTIDLWLGEVTISIHLSARIEVTAPPFHAVARFEVGPIGLTVEIGERATEPRYIAWDAFVRKYLEEAAPGRARVLAAVAGAGAVPPAGSSATGGADAPDGTPARPFRVVAEFELTVTSTAPLRALVAGGPRRELAASTVVSVAPMGQATPADILLTLRMVGPASGGAADRIARLQAVPQQLGAFPIGTWGVAPDLTRPRVPAGDVISATDRVLLRAVAEIPGTRPGDPVPPAIPYRQVETGARRILPFVTETGPRRALVLTAVQELAALVPTAAGGAARMTAAAVLLAGRGGRSPADVAAWRADRAAAPLLGSLGEGLGRAPRPVLVEAVAPPAAKTPPPLRPPRVRALLVAPEVREPAAARIGGAGERLAAATRTTVSARLREELRPLQVPAPTLAGVEAGLLGAVPARLLRLAPSAVGAVGTVVAAMAPPLTRTVLPGVEIGAGRAAEPASRARLDAFAAALVGGGLDSLADTHLSALRAETQAARVGAGEVAVLELPDAARDGDARRRPALAVRGGRVRVVALGPAGGVAADRALDGTGGEASLPVPPATRALVVIGLGEDDGAGEPELAGWVAGVPLPSATDGVLIGTGCVVDAAGRVPARGVTALPAGWVAPDDLVSGESAVSTTFARPVAAVAVALEGGTGDDVALGVEGAHRPAGADGAPEAPLLVAAGARSVLVFRLRDSRPGTVLTATTGAARRLTGVAAVPADAQAGADPAAWLADAVARLGLAALVPPVAEPGAGGADLTWKEP